MTRYQPGGAISTMPITHLLVFTIRRWAVTELVPEFGSRLPASGLSGLTQFRGGGLGLRGRAGAKHGRKLPDGMAGFAVQRVGEVGGVSAAGFEWDVGHVGERILHVGLVR